MDRLPQHYRCGECATAAASYDCKECMESYCAECSTSVHSKGMRKSHTKMVRLFVCQRCVAAPATVACRDCDGRVYCDRCNARLHGPKGKYKKHVDIKPAAEYYGTAEAKKVVNHDEENAFNLKVADLVASPGRFAHTAGDVTEAAQDAEEASRLTIRLDSSDGSKPPKLRIEDAQKEGESNTNFMYVEPAPHEISVHGVEDRIWGWRRLSRLHPEGFLFDVSNDGVATTFKYAKPAFPSTASADVAESLGLRDATAAPAQQQGLKSLPRLVSNRSHDIALDERGVDLAVLSIALAGTAAPLASVFHSVGHRNQGMYSLQFYREATVAEEITDLALAAGMPITELSPARHARGGQSSSRRRRWPDPEPEAQIMSPKHQEQLLVAATGDTLCYHFLLQAHRRHREAVTIDDIVPIGHDGKPIFGLTESVGERWKVVLEKALARFWGSYASLENANPVNVLRCLTGGRVTAESWSSVSDVADLFPDLGTAARFVWWRLEAAKRVGQIVLLTHRTASQTPDAVEPRCGSPGVDARDAELDEAEAEATANRTEEPYDSPAALVASSNGPAKSSRLDAFAHQRTVSDIPCGWGDAAWATEAGSAMDVTDAAIALFTAELAVTQANALGFRRTSTSGAPPSDDGWKLAKLHQLGGDLGAERFSFAHFSGQWTKDLRDYFDFKTADPSVVFATPEDLAEEFDTITCCSEYTGAPPSASFVLRPADSPQVATAAAVQILVVLRPGVAQLSVHSASAFDLKQGKAAKATSAMTIRVAPLPATTAAWLKPLRDLTSAEEVSALLPVPPLVSVNLALGLSEALPDKFLARTLPTSEPAGSDVGSAVVVVINQTYFRDAFSGVIGFDPSEVQFATVLGPH